MLPTWQQIEKAAYERWERRGSECPDTQELEPEGRDGGQDGDVLRPQCRNDLLGIG